jgi:hypothetical protein
VVLTLFFASLTFLTSVSLDIFIGRITALPLGLCHILRSAQNLMLFLCQIQRKIPSGKTHDYK